MFSIACISFCAVCAVSALISSPATANQNHAAGFLLKTIKLNSKAIKYVVYVPSVYDARKPIPTILFLHGKGECGTDGLRQITVGLGGAVMQNVEKWPYLIVFPQKQEEQNDWEQEEEMVMAILDRTIKEYNVDKNRLYLTGLSQGGHGSWAIAARHPHMFAAVAPICGWGSKWMAEKLSGTPIWAFHGTEDPIVRVDETQKMVKFLEEAGGSCKATFYPGVGHNCWDKAYREENLYEWFLQYHK